MNLNILYQSDENFVIPMGVSILSLFEHNKEIENINLYIIDNNIEDTSKTKLIELAQKYGRSINFIQINNIENFLISNNVNQQQSNSYTTFYKIFATSQLKELDKILYIDCDTLVLDSLAELCDYNLNDYACGMVCSAINGHLKSFLRLKEYYNGGVIYINLDYWRKHKIENRFIDNITNSKSKINTLVGDESLFNLTLKGKIKKMPLKYNFESTWWLWGWNKKLYKALNWKKPEDAYYSMDEIKKAKKKPTIAHYLNLTTGRPWDLYNDNPFKKEYNYYLDLLKPWKSINTSSETGIFKKFLLKTKHLVLSNIPFSLRSFLGYIQNTRNWDKKIKKTKEGI